MNDNERNAYVRAALVMQGYAFDDPRIDGIIRQFERIETIGAVLLEGELPIDAEPAPAFRP